MLDKLHIIYFHGFLAKKFGKNPFTIYGTSLRDVTQGLIVNLGEEFKQIIKEGAWHITTGKPTGKKLSKQDNFLSEQEIEMNLDDVELHFYPAIVGAGKGIGQIILGIVLIIVVIVCWWNPLGWGAGGALIAGSTAASLAVAGVGMVLSGVTSMMTKSPSMSGSYGNAEVDQKPSFLYNGIVNVIEQGGPVPVVYGTHFTGSTVISAGLSVEQI